MVVGICPVLLGFRVRGSLKPKLEGSDLKPKEPG